MKKIFMAFLKTLLFIFFVSAALGFFSEIGHSPAGWEGALMIAFAATIIGALALLVFGIPAHLFLQYKGITSKLWYFLLGFMPGIVIVFVFHFFGNDTFIEKVQQSLALGLFGAFSAVVFSFFAVENPHNKALNKDATTVAPIS